MEMSTMTKKALFVSDHGDPLAKLGGKQAGGQNNYVKQLALALEKEGWQIDVVTHWCDASAPKIEQFGTACRVIRIEAMRQRARRQEAVDLLLRGPQVAVHKQALVGAIVVEP